VIAVGGHVAAIPRLEAIIDADHIVRGEGISWMRRYLGEHEHTPVRHPAIVSDLQTRIMGVRLPPSAERWYGRNHHPVGGLPHGMQLLYHVCFFWR